MGQAVEEILNGKFNVGNGSLDFSCPRIELSLYAGEASGGSFTVYGPEEGLTEGSVLSSDLRMVCLTQSFSGSSNVIEYRFDSQGMEAGDEVKGAFSIISNHGEYYLPFSVTVMPGTVDSSMGGIRNLFHFTNLAKSNWDEAVKLFYSEQFKTVFAGNDRQYYAAYKGLSAITGNEHNVEEFLLEIHKKKPVEYIPEETEIRIEDPAPQTRYSLVLNRNGWGYTHLKIGTEGGFLRVEEDTVSDASFLGNIYRLYYYIDHEAACGQQLRKHSFDTGEPDDQGARQSGGARDGKKGARHPEGKRTSHRGNDGILPGVPPQKDQHQNVDDGDEQAAEPADGA